MRFPLRDELWWETGRQRIRPKGIDWLEADDPELGWAVGSRDGSAQASSAPAARQSSANASSASSESALSRTRVITRLTPSSR